jgi:hypothetical protein
MQIYIHRKNEDFGPYSREALQEYLKHGIFEPTDYACYEGMSGWKTVSELLGIPVAAPSKTVKLEEATALDAAAPDRHHASRLHDFVRKRSFLIGLNILLLACIAIGAYVRLGHHGENVRKLVAPVGSHAIVKTQATIAEIASVKKPVNGTKLRKKKKAAVPPAPLVLEAPAVVAVSTPAPVVVSTPAPTKPFDPAGLAGTPAVWPKMLKLKQAVDFPAVFNEQVVGSVNVPAGSEVKLLNIQGEELTVDFQGGTQNLSWKLTNLEEEVARSGRTAAVAASATNVTATSNTPGN